MQKEPPPFVWAVPDEKNILTCELVSVFSLISTFDEDLLRELYHCEEILL